MSRAPLSEQQKRDVIKNHAAKYGLKIFIETGTQMGLMVDYAKDIFEQIYTIEILNNYYDDAIKKFNGYKNIKLFLGDSAVVLDDIMSQMNIDVPILFWLDAHNYTYSPALKELEIIFKHGTNNGSMILIDDMRNFDKGRKDYPTKQQLIDIVKKNKPEWQVVVVKDIMRIGRDVSE